MAALGLLLLAVACKTAEPVTVYPSFTTSPAMAAHKPAEIAVLPVEDGSPASAASRHLVFLRQEIMRQLVDRLYTPLSAPVVDAALKGNADAAAAREAKTSVLEPVYLKKIAGISSEDAVLALRVDAWDESHLLTSHRLAFQFQAALVSNTGEQLWYGTINGNLKAGGAGTAPRDRDYMARSCGELAIRELMLRLPARLP
jgi:hypothetical protein